MSGKHAQEQAAIEKWTRWKERAGKSQGFPPPPSESQHRAGRDTPCWRCDTLPEWHRTSQEGKGFVLSLASPSASRAVMGVSGGAFRSANSAFLQGTAASAVVQCKTVCPNLTYLVLHMASFSQDKINLNEIGAACFQNGGNRNLPCTSDSELIHHESSGSSEFSCAKKSS